VGAIATADGGRARLGRGGLLRGLEDVETLDLAAGTLLEGANEAPGLAGLALAGIGNGVALDLAQAASGTRGQNGLESGQRGTGHAARRTRRRRTDHLSQAVSVRGRLR
jgi:hypothetical protein